MVSASRGAGSGLARGPAVLTAVSAALIGIRRAKTEAKASQKTPVTSLTVSGPHVEALRLAEGDLRAVGRIETISFAEADTTTVADIVFAPQEA